MNKVFILVLLVFSTSWAQSIHETEFYKMVLPLEYSANPYQSSKEEFANIDSFMLSHHESPRYLLMVMSNKLTANFDGISLDNYMDYIEDIGTISIISAEKSDDFIRVKFIDKKKENISFVAYLNAKNDILNRFVFFIPQKVGDIYEKEITQVIKSIEYKKIHW